VTEEREHVVEQLAAYALDALDEPERSQVHAHVSACRSCAARLGEHQTIVGTLPLTLPAVPPPAEAWRTIASAVRERRRRASPRLVVGRRWLRIAGWSATVALVTVLLVWNVALQRQLSRYADGPQVEKLARRPGRLVILTGTTQPEASARLFAAVDGRSGHMAVSGLKPPAAGRVFQLWFLRHAGPPENGATFTVDRDGRAWVVVSVPGPLDETRAIIVTEEPAPGSPAPTGPRLLEAEHWR
jgi:anti-sigma-K factor RskA